MGRSTAWFDILALMHSNRELKMLNSKILCFRFRIWPLLLPLMLVASTVSADELEQRDIAFYYGSRPPVEDLRHFDQIVIQPSQVLPHERTALLNLDSLIFAYISFGEIARNSDDMERIDTKWSIGVNPAWNSLVMDMNDPAWHEYLLEHHFGRLWRDGYRAFFLDTVDSYLLVTKEGAERTEQEKGLVALLAEVKRRFPGCKLILNRGFEVLDRASQYADGMVAESLFQGFDPVTGKHAPVKEENRTWLLSQLRRVQDEFKVPVIVLDYVEPGNWTEGEKNGAGNCQTGVYALGRKWRFDVVGAWPHPFSAAQAAGHHKRYPGATNGSGSVQACSHAAGISRSGARLLVCR